MLRRARDDTTDRFGQGVERPAVVSPRAEPTHAACANVGLSQPSTESSAALKAETSPAGTRHTPG